MTRPPAPPQDGLTGDGPGYVFAVTKLIIATDASSKFDKNAWKQLGYDIDGMISTRDSVDVCQPNSGSLSTGHDDGLDGIDNAWGKELWPVLLGLVPHAEDEINEAFRSGSRTHLLHIETLGDAPSYLELPSSYYIGATLGSIPKLDGTDVWPLTAESLAHPRDERSSRWPFPHSYVTDHVWVSGEPGTLLMPLQFGGRLWMLTVHHAVVSMRLSPDRTAVEHGVISGILDTEEVVEEMRRYAGDASPSLCDGVTFTAIANQLRQASDILLDGSQDPNRTCDGISIGLGFEGARVKLGNVAAPTLPPPDPCAD